MDTYCARFRGAPDCVGEARQAVIDYACLCGFASDDIADVAFAVGEALANAVEHGTRDLGLITVTCAYDGHGLTIEIHDQGPGFDFVVVPRPRDPLSGRGSGITIMRELMDRVTFWDRGNGAFIQARPPKRRFVR